MSRRIYLGIFLKSFAILMFEVCLMRILAITLWHHFAFLIISCALLGFGISGSWLVVFSRPQKPYWPAFIFSCTLFPLVLFANRIEIKPALLSLDVFHWLDLLVVFLILAIPFFFSGLTINSIFRRYPQNAFKLYCYDLIGASCGCGAFFIVAPHFKELEWIILISMVGFLASLALSDSVPKSSISLVLTVICLTSLFLQPPLKLQVNQYKSLPLALKYKNSQLLESRWNSASKVSWFKSPIMKHAPGLSLNYRGKIPEQLGISIDNDQLTAFTPRATTIKDLTDSLPIALPFELSPTDKKILIINALGGDAILPALGTTAEIDLQTENALLADWHRKQNLPDNINILFGSARSILANSLHQYSKIIVSLEDSLPSGLGGVSSLKLNPLYTREGIRSLLKRLDNNGWLVFHLYLLPPPRTELRLLATLYEEIKKQNLNPVKHVGMLQTVSTVLIVFSHHEWTPNDIKIFKEFTKRNSFIPILFPDALPEVRLNALRTSPLYAQQIYHLFDNYNSFQNNSVFNLEPLSDNKPYFNFYLKFGKIKEYLAQFDYKWEAVIEGGLLVIILLGFVILFSILTIGLPFLIKSRDWNFFSGQLFYFFWIGIGFMSVEIALIEKLTLFFGEPVYSFAIALCCLLLASAIGARRAAGINRGNVRYVFGLLLSILIIYGFFLSKVLFNLAGLGFWGRILVGILIVCPVGVFLGYFFPYGISRIAASTEGNPLKCQNQIALAWCYNGVASVIGSVGSIFICQALGINYLFFLAAFFYLMAYLGFR